MWPCGLLAQKDYALGRNAKPRLRFSLAPPFLLLLLLLLLLSHTHTLDRMFLSFLAYVYN